MMNKNRKPALAVDGIVLTVALAGLSFAVIDAMRDQDNEEPAIEPLSVSVNISAEQRGYVQSGVRTAANMYCTLVAEFSDVVTTGVPELNQAGIHAMTFDECMTLQGGP